MAGCAQSVFRMYGFEAWLGCFFCLFFFSAGRAVQIELVWTDW